MKRFSLNTGRFRFGCCTTPNAQGTIAFMEKLRKAIKCSLIIAAGFFSMFAMQAQTKPGNTASTLELWLNADSTASITYDATSRVSVWKDISGYNASGDPAGNKQRALRNIGPGAGATAENATQRPTYITGGGMNFHPAVQFAASQSLRDTSFAQGKAYHTFVVSKATGTTGQDRQNVFHLIGHDAGGYVSHGISWNTTRQSALARACNGTYEGQGNYDEHQTTGKTYGIIHTQWPYTTNTSFRPRLYLNGVGNSVNITGYVMSNYTDAQRREGYKMTLGASNGMGDSFVGNVQEVVVLSTATGSYLPDGDRDKINSYLAIKYGITLAAGDYVNSVGASVWTRGSNTGYTGHIFGIGRDNASGLYQKQSRSAESGLTTLFIGDKVTTLNSQNTGNINNDKSFVMFGSNGLEGAELRSVAIAKGAQYINDTVAAPNGMNIQSKTIYKAQVTNYTDRVNLAVNMTEYLYVMVSSDENFTPGDTYIYPIKSGTAEVSIDNTYKYIRYAGYSKAYSNAMPGGIADNGKLRLWLNAENEMSLTIDYVNPGSGTLAGYTGAYGNTVLPLGALPAVREWNDFMRNNAKYEYLSSSNTARMPVLYKKPMETNYHPSVQFWGDNSSINAYLVNNTGLMNTANPTDKQQTFIIVSNNNDPRRDAANDRTWFMAFGTTSANNGNGFGSTASLSPGYGIKHPDGGNTNVYAAINTNAGDATARSDGNSNNKVLFSAGSTSVLTWRTHQFSGSNLQVNFDINGMSSGNITNVNNNSFAMNGRSTLGVGYTQSRQTQGLISEVILFEEELLDDDLSKIESYLGIKYGITLKESTNNANVNNNINYDYKMSDGAGGSTVFWPGKSDALFQQYHNNVAAVIRDDAATLYNPQSHSTDLGSILHMGVAGTKLGFNSGVDDVGDLDYDREAIVWGSDTITGITGIQTQPCGDFENIFKKKWLVHKKTDNNRPITMLVGAQNNSVNNLGLKAAPQIQEMYEKLGAGYDVYLIVGNSPADIDSRNYEAVVPMSYIDGEHQCSYTFTDEITYITFGYRANQNGCASEEFSGKKTVDWKAWTRYNYNILDPAQTIVPPNAGTVLPIDLGDDIKVTDMKITYDQNVRSENYYPITGNSPFKGGLQLRRNRGNANSSKVTVEVTFNHPVIPSFSIAGLDAHWSQYDAVQVVGYCGGSGVLPTLSYAGNPQNARYTIVGSKATVNKNTRGSGTDANSCVNIDFEGGVDRIVIEYTIANRVNGSISQEIYISPITLSPILLPPPVNEDGLSFVKEVKERDITTCEPVEYSFYIQNTNCEDKYVHFSDTLPPGMKWVDTSLALDSMNWLHNNKLDIIDYGGTDALDIDSLLIPGTKTLKFRATAVLDETAPGGQYNNRASIVYHKLGQIPPKVQKSVDRETLKDYTWFNATFAQRQDTVLLTAAPSPQQYAVNKEITVTYTVDNPNADITDMFLNIAFDANFEYKTSSFSSSLGAAAQYVAPDPLYANNPSICIAGSTDGANGFTLPGNTSTTFTFTLRAPMTKADLDLDATTGKPSDLTISYEFSTTLDDPCVLESLSGLSGEMKIPYKSALSHIIINKHVTLKFKK